MHKKFNIESIVEIYKPILFDITTLGEKESEFDSNIEKMEALNEILLSKKAKETVFNHIDWNKNTTNNSVEQGGLLIGHSYIDEQNQKIIGYVEEAIPALTAKGSMTYLEFDHTTWKLMIDQLDIMNEKKEGTDLQIIGWYHTHPGRLSVFMSGTDVNTQKKMFSMDWQFAIVLNPQKQIWRAFNGAEAKECKGYMLK